MLRLQNAVYTASSLLIYKRLADRCTDPLADLLDLSQQGSGLRNVTIVTVSYRHQRCVNRKRLQPPRRVLAITSGL